MRKFQSFLVHLITLLYKTNLKKIVICITKSETVLLRVRVYVAGQAENEF